MLRIIIGYLFICVQSLVYLFNKLFSPLLKAAHIKHSTHVTMQYC